MSKDKITWSKEITYTFCSALKISTNDATGSDLRAARYMCDDDQGDLILYKAVGTGGAFATNLKIKFGVVDSDPSEPKCDQIAQPLTAADPTADPKVLVSTEIRGAAKPNYITYTCRHGASIPGGPGVHRLCSALEFAACRAALGDCPGSHLKCEWP